MEADRAEEPQQEEPSELWDTYDQHYGRMGNVPPAMDASYRGKEPHLRAEWLPQKKEAAILDIGFGWGNLLRSLWISGYRNLYGVDISRPMYEAALDGLPEGIELECADPLIYLEAHPGCFDLITLFDVIEHMPTRRALGLLKGCLDALQPSGKVVLRTPNMANLLAHYIRYADLTHVQGYTEWSLYQLLDMAGFSDHRVVVENLSGLAGWKSQATIRHPFAGLNIEGLLSIALHRVLFALHPQIPRPSMYDFNISVQSTKAVK